MNTITELINEYHLNETVANQIVNRYTEMIGTRYGINEIADVTYTGDRHRDIKLVCTKCGKVTHMDYVAGRNKLREISKTCECQKVEKSPKIKKAIIYNTDPSYIGKVFGSFEVVGIEKTVSNSTVWCVRCVNCNTLRKTQPFNVKRGIRCTVCNPKKENQSKWVGQKINRLTILAVYQKNGYSMAHCVCDCGKEYDGQLSNIRYGKVKSCGCLAKELREMHVVNADAISKSPLYHVWSGMKQRCNNPNVDSYPDYGGRGIAVCKEWSDDFKVFETWAIENGYRPNRGLSIDRIDVNGNYCPENCRWTNVFVQSVNRRPPKPPKAIKGGFTINGVTKTKKAWCEEYGVWTATVDYRMKKMGMTFEEALTAEKKSEGNHLAALNLPESKVKQLDNLNRTNSHIEANLYMAFIRKNFSDRVVSQHTIGKYRVDFWIEGTDIVVECDGLEFHKGKDQLKSDYERERYLVIHGFRVLRYTGSEINQDPDAVADEIIGFAEGGLQWQDQQMTKKTISSECESIAT